MRKIVPLITCFCVSLTLVKGQNNPLEVKEYKLKNGLTVLMNEDHSLPVVHGMVVVKAGSKHNPNTGIAHYFEHIMFKGTDKIGTLNYELEKPLLDSIEVQYDQLAQTTDPQQRKAIQLKINELSIKASEYVIPNEFDRLISRYGGSKLNAGTGFDQTIYYNQFSPQFIRQWAEINSERLISPVFRMFQSELETVYEEKNMYSDQLGGLLIEKVLERYFAPHPYMYPIIGSAENLKNPRLSEMTKFFNDYYVAGNMALVLAGDIDSETLLPMLEETFGRIRMGEAPLTPSVQPAPFNGHEKFDAKLPIPIIKAAVVAWRGVPANHKDEVAMKVATGLLTNGNSTGYLDKLMSEDKVMTTAAFSMGLSDAGFTGFLVVPKILFQSTAKAEKLVLAEVERIKRGDFTEEAFNNLKLEAKRNFDQNLENLKSRTTTMALLYTEGKTWGDYLNEQKAIASLTKEDVIAVANKYFTDNYLEIRKKTGNYPKNRIEKPGFEPIVPKNTEKQSEYAKQLEQTQTPEYTPRFVDFNKDVQTINLAPKATLYMADNPVNDLFTLNIDYGIGTFESKKISPMSIYVSYLGTDSLNFTEFRTALQNLGSTISFSSADDYFRVSVSGFDSEFEQTVILVDHFMKHLKADESKLKTLKSSTKIEYGAIKKSADALADVLLEKVAYGDKSEYLNRLSLSQVKRLKSQELITEFKNALKVECVMHYSGRLKGDYVAEVIKNHIQLDEISVDSKSPIYRELLPVQENTVYFLNMPSVSQSIVFSYMRNELRKPEERQTAMLFNEYFGGGMSSLLFQEIREFRSFAYRVGSRYSLPPNNQQGRPAKFQTMLSTQLDKTIDAIHVLDSLLRDMPVRAERMGIVRQEIINNANNDFPNFREISQKVANWKQVGYQSDPNEVLVDAISEMDIDDVVDFHHKNIQSSPIAYIIVGNSKKVDLKQLERFGKVVEVKAKDIYK